MEANSLRSGELNTLCTEEQLELLDSIDTLRSQGISYYISLPQIIVCGDQSSGKSSVLEAISGVPFPVKSNLCTRFPTELVLRKSSQTSVSVSIVPHQSRAESDRISLSNFREKLDSFYGLPALIENAKTVMGITAHGKTFSNDLLRVEVSGPDRPHLTIVDLPGLIHSETKQQSAADVQLVQEVVQNYMKEPRSIILAVISAKNDYANQVVLRLAREADPFGHRTLGIITKPDSLISGSESEKMFVSLAKNQDVAFRLGWHVLKNMDSEKGSWTLQDRNSHETLFFSQGVWVDMPKPLIGIDQLRERLSLVLLGQIAAELPSLVNEIKTKVDTCHMRLQQLGKPRTNPSEQRHYLLKISESFQHIVKASVDGIYNESFFADVETDAGYSNRMRAVVQNLNERFATTMALHGHYREIKSSESLINISKHQLSISREEYISHIQRLLKRTRGQELPGTFNPLIVKDLFFEQSGPWERITRDHIRNVWVSAKRFIRQAVCYVADDGTSKALLREIFEPRFDHILHELNEKVSELLAPHRRGHPITYNEHFTEVFRRHRNERIKAGISDVVQTFFGVDQLQTTYLSGSDVDLSLLVDAIVRRTEPDLEQFASEEALGFMEAYYKVALKRYIDDIAIEVIESKLICSLGHIFSPIVVFELPDSRIQTIAGESRETRMEREQLGTKLEILTKGMNTCERFLNIPAMDQGSLSSSNLRIDDCDEDALLVTPSTPVEHDMKSVSESLDDLKSPEGDNDVAIPLEQFDPSVEQGKTEKRHMKAKKKSKKRTTWDD